MRLRARFTSRLVIAFCALTLPYSGIAAEQAAKGAEKSATVVEKGRKVSVEYTLTLDDGTVAATNVGRKPITFEQGSGQMLPAFEEQIVGLAAGASKKFDLTVEQGYGPVRKELYETVAASTIPEKMRVVGASLVAQAPNGQKRPVRVREIKGDKIVLDLNHPLAGKSLHFAIKVVSIE